jgi:DNA-binding transcriptional LysR family regulator
MHSISIDTRRLTIFLTVAEELHFRRAAKRLHMSQPPLSMAIRSLEEDLGVQLLERSTRAVRLTRSGMHLYEHGQRLLQDMIQLETQVQQVATGQIGALRLGFVGIAMWMDLPNVIRDFRAAFPKVQLQLDESPSANVQEQVLAGRLDLGLVRALDKPDARLENKLIYEENYWLAIPASHPFAKRQRIRLSDLDNQSLLFFPRRFDPSIYDKWQQVLTMAGVTPRLVQEARSVHTELALVQAEVGLCLVTAATTRAQRDGVVYRKLIGDIPKVRVFAVWDGEHAHEIRTAFVKRLISGRRK